MNNKIEKYSATLVFIVCILFALFVSYTYNNSKADREPVMGPGLFISLGHQHQSFYITRMINDDGVEKVCFIQNSILPEGFIENCMKSDFIKDWMSRSEGKITRTNLYIDK
jgi:hypothetical protein